MTFLAFVHCSGSQFTQVLEPQQLETSLYGQSRNDVTIQAPAQGRIAWMGLDQSADYKYFKIEKIRVNGQEIQPPAFSSVAVIEDVPFQAPAGADFSEIVVTLNYNPLQEAKEGHHQANLLVVYEGSQTGTVSVPLHGKVAGVAAEKCAGDARKMSHVTYEIDEVTVFVCDNDGVPDHQVTPSAPGEKTNRAQLELKDRAGLKEKVHFYLPDHESVCILGEREDVSASTMPDFNIPIPKGISETTDRIGALSARLPEGAFAECRLDKGNIRCDSNVQLEVLGGQVPVTPFSITNKDLNPASENCRSFKARSDSADFPSAIAGEGNVAGTGMTVIAAASVGANGNTTAYKIDGALVLAKIRLSNKTKLQ